MAEISERDRELFEQAMGKAAAQRGEWVMAHRTAFDSDRAEKNELLSAIATAREEGRQEARAQYARADGAIEVEGDIRFTGCSAGIIPPGTVAPKSEPFRCPECELLVTVIDEP